VRRDGEENIFAWRERRVRGAHGRQPTGRTVVAQLVGARWG
jgi:hypothetical protein